MAVCAVSVRGYDGKPPIRGLGNLPISLVQQEEKTERGLYCCLCKTRITSWHERIAVDGRHFYEFANPLGVVYKIGCFRSAEGCRPEGQPEAYWSWFAGYVWQIQRCVGCFQHLGWLYTKPDHAFYGLVMASLCEV